MTSDEGGRERNFKGAGAALEFALWSLDQQQQTFRGFDGKSERALTLAVAILAVYAAASTTFPGADMSAVSNRPLWLIVSLVLFVIFFAIAGIFFHSQAALCIHLGPGGEYLLAISAKNTDLRTRQWLAENIYQSIDHNEGVIATRGRRYKWLAYALLAEAIVAGVAILIAVSA